MHHCYRHHEISVGLIIDNVSEVLTISDDDIAVPPSNRTGFENKYIKGIGKSENCVTLLLDCEKLLNDDEIYAVSNI